MALIAGCDQPFYSEAYLLEHHHILLKQSKKCRKHAAHSKQCEAVKKAEEIFADYDKAYLNDQEAYGLQLLHMQMALVQLEGLIEVTELQWQQSDRQQDVANKRQLAKKLDLMKQDYVELQHKIKIMLEVIGQYSPV